MAESSEPPIPVVPRSETAMSTAEEERWKAMLDKILARMDEQGRKMDDMISSLAATTSRLLGAAADSTPSSPSTTVGLATVSSWAVAVQPTVNTCDVDTNFTTPTKCSTPCPDHDDGKLTATTTRASTTAMAAANSATVVISLMTSVAMYSSPVEAAPHVTNLIAVRLRCLGVNSSGRIICKPPSPRQARGGRSFRKASTSRQVHRPLSTVRVQQLAARQVFDEIPCEAEELPAWEEGYYTSTRQWQTMILGSDHVVFVELPQDNKPREQLSQEHLKAWLQPVAATSSAIMGVKQCTAPMSRWCMHGPGWLVWSCGAHAVAASDIESTLKLGSDQDTRCIDDNGWLFPCEICVVQSVFKEIPSWENSSPWNSVVEVARFVFNKVLAWSREGFSPGGAVIMSKKTTLLVHGASVTLISLFITRPWDPGVFHSAYHFVHYETRIDQVISTKNKGTFQLLKYNGQEALFSALQRVKEELMFFISFLPSVFQNFINHNCIPESAADLMLPCIREISKATEDATKLCKRKGEVPMLSKEALHQLHIFILVLGVVHVVFCVTTLLLGVAKMRKWEKWEKDFHQGRFKERTQRSIDWVKLPAVRWIIAFFKQLYDSVGKPYYQVFRAAFVQRHYPNRPDFKFHKYMVRALEHDFKEVVGVSWYLWFFVIFFLRLNINGWHTYFWLSFLPLILLLIVGTKLEYISTRLAQEAADCPDGSTGNPWMKPCKEHFWFGKPRIVLHLIHFILFQNSFEMAFFLWVLATYGFDCQLVDPEAAVEQGGAQASQQAVKQHMDVADQLSQPKLVTEDSKNEKSIRLEQHNHRPEQEQPHSENQLQQGDDTNQLAASILVALQWINFQFSQLGFDNISTTLFMVKFLELNRLCFNISSRNIPRVVGLSVAKRCRDMELMVWLVGTTIVVGSLLSVLLLPDEQGDDTHSEFMKCSFEKFYSSSSDHMFEGSQRCRCKLSTSLKGHQRHELLESSSLLISAGVNCNGVVAGFSLRTSCISRGGNCHVPRSMTYGASRSICVCVLHRLGSYTRGPMCQCKEIGS